MKHLKTYEAFSFDYEGVEIRNPFTDELVKIVKKHG